MDLKDRFNKHQTEVDVDAWAHFQLLRRNKKPKRRFLWWFFTGSGLCVLLTGLAFWQWNSYHSNYQDIRSTIKKSAINQVPNKNHLPTKKEQSATIIPIDDGKINQKSFTNLTTKDYPKSTKSAKIKSKSNLTVSTATNQILSATTNSSANTDRQKSVSSTNNLLLIDSASLSYKTDSPVLDTVSRWGKNTFTTTNLALIESPLIRFLTIPDTSKVINSPITKPLKRTKNTLKLSIGHANAFVNGFSTENPVDKRGFSIQGAYYHEWNKIIGTGISAGYVKTLDRENPSFQIKDREIIKYIHADLYLFLYNERKHKLYAKIGAGLTNTDRILAGFFVPVNGTVERIFQINNLTNIGYSVEAAYEYQLKTNFSIGANLGIISHNDGGWFTGLSVGYHF